MLSHNLLFFCNTIQVTEYYISLICTVLIGFSQGLFCVKSDHLGRFFFLGWGGKGTMTLIVLHRLVKLDVFLIIKQTREK